MSIIHEIGVEVFFRTLATKKTWNLSQIQIHFQMVWHLEKVANVSFYQTGVGKMRHTVGQNKTFNKVIKHAF